jgi:hypothetical protein
MRIFGREPAAILNVASALVALVIGMGWFGLTENQGQAIIGVVSAGTSAWVAFSVRPIVPTVLTGLITSGFALMAAFDWVHVTERQVGLWVAFAEIALTALAVRPHSTPVIAPAPPDHSV